MGVIISTALFDNPVIGPIITIITTIFPFQIIFFFIVLFMFLGLLIVYNTAVKSTSSDKDKQPYLAFIGYLGYLSVINFFAFLILLYITKKSTKYGSPID